MSQKMERRYIISHLINNMTKSIFKREHTVNMCGLLLKPKKMDFVEHMHGILQKHNNFHHAAAFATVFVMLMAVWAV